ncbi:hypothetical protein B5P45_19045 [Phyllobacterium zundukense]|uniref:Uncharacterized protein n=1 Tax=Phyllobacterium zundukense TaxID=1867719 RepID=A0A2N9VUM0_9HYPH|nr:hypothetical protein B5P45_19045 [Phyllobacterium zundukense]
MSCAFRLFRAAPFAASMAVQGSATIGPHLKGRNEMEGGRVQLSCFARNGGAADRGRKLPMAVAGGRSR